MLQFFYSLISFIVSLFFILFGIICMMVPWDPSIRTIVLLFILENSITIVLFGFGFFLIGVSVITYLLQSFRKRTYYVRTDARAICIEEGVIQSYIQSFWKNAYPSHEIPHRFTIRKNKLYLFADLPYSPPLQQKDIVERIQNELGALLRTTVGYHHDLHLSLSFQNSKVKT